MTRSRNRKNKLGMLGIRSLVVAFCAIAATVACNKGVTQIEAQRLNQKLTAEEAGYVSFFEKKFDSLLLFGTEYFLRDAEMNVYTDVGDKRKKEKSRSDRDLALRSLVEAALEVRPTLAKSLAPSSLSSVHRSMQNLIAAALEEAPVYRIRGRVGDASRAMFKFWENAETRNNVQLKPGKLTYSFSVSGVPVGIVGSSDGDFALVPIIGGDFVNLSAAYESPGGPILLIVRYSGQDRYLKLDRPFRLTLPASLGSELENTIEGTFIVSVK